MTIHDDERTFLLRLAEVRPQQTREGATADDIAAELNIPMKRAYFLYAKWSRQGIWDSGVSDRTGWLTPKGLMTAHEWASEPARDPP